MGPVLSHTAALRGRKFGGNGRTRVTTLYYNPPHFILNTPPSDKSNLLLLLSESCRGGSWVDGQVAELLPSAELQTRHLVVVRGSERYCGHGKVRMRAGG